MRSAASAPAPALVRALALVLVLVFGLAACGGKRVDAPRAAALPLFASIPADTPYVVASFEAIPLEVLATYRDTLGGAMRRAFENIADEDEDEDDEDGGDGGDGEGEGGDGDADAGADKGRDVFRRLMTAFFAELDGKWTAEGVESIGLSATPRFALYGLGLYPVARLEIRDGGRLFSTLERIAQRAQLTLPPPERREGRRFWRIVEGAHAFVIAITADQLVLAYSPSARLGEALPHLLGLERPARSMADGGALAAARATYGLGGQMVALADTRQLATRLLAGDGAAPACTAEIDRLAARVPRVVSGYAIRPETHDMTAVVELAPDLAAEIGALRVELPGLAEIAADKPLLMVGGGLDLARAQPLAVAAAQAIARAAAACGRSSEPFAEAAAELGQPLPPILAQLRGGVLSIQTLALATGPIPLPTELEAFALVTARDAGPLLDLARVILPADFKADGALHRLPEDRLPIPLPFELFVGAGPQRIVLAAGAGGLARASRAVGARPAPAPLLVSEGDYGKFLELRAQTETGPERELDAAQARLYGRMQWKLDATARGLELRVAFETKPRGR